MGLGLRKLKSERDIRGKLRKQPRTSEDSSTVSSRHQRIPSIAPILPLPSHIARTAIPSSHSNSSDSRLRPRVGSTARSQHRRSRSFSALTSLISPSLSSFSDQPWRSRDAWLAIHARPASPPPISTIPSAHGGSEAGWRRKGNGGFFARELAGVGESALPLPYAGSARPGASRSQTMGDLAGQLDKLDIEQRAGDSSIEVVSERQCERVELAEWKPGFATSLFRKKTQCVPIPPLHDYPSPEIEEEEQEVVTPPPPAASRPESRCLPDSPPPPPSFRRPHPRIHTPTSSNLPIRTASTSSASIRTSQSSSIHTYESAELHYRNLDTGETSSQPPLPELRRVSATRSSHYTSARSSSHRRHSSDDLDGQFSRTSSLLPPDELPTIVTPTSTYYHFTSPRSSTDDHHNLDFSVLREKFTNNPPNSYAETQHIDMEGINRRASYSMRSLKPQGAKQPHQQHMRDESLPALLPAVSLPLREVQLQAAGGDRMRGVPWARAHVQRAEGGEGGQSARLGEKRGSQVGLSRGRVMDRVREVDEGQQALPLPRPLGGGSEARWSRGARGVLELDGKREAVRGGWV